VLFFVHGKSGNNGKSTLVSPVRDMLGDYGSHTPTETLLTKQYDNNIPADARGPRAASCRMSLSNVKSETALRSRLFSSSRSFSRFTCSVSLGFLDTFGVDDQTKNTTKRFLAGAARTSMGAPTWRFVSAPLMAVRDMKPGVRELSALSLLAAFSCGLARAHDDIFLSRFLVSRRQ